MFIKYPRTFHFPWSPGLQNDDRMIETLDHFQGREVVVTEKMDGENTTMHRNMIHARSLDSRDHESRHMVKQLHASFAHEIPEGWRICGENLYATHSIHYENLLSYFYGFSIWNDQNVALSWDETIEWFHLLGIVHPQVLYRGIFDVEVLKDIPGSLDNQEGYVCRIVDSFDYSDFDKVVAKYVRKGHVQTDEHWMYKEVIPNLLVEE